MQPFAQVEHTADYAIVAHGSDLQELIENAGRGMVSLLVESGEVAVSQSVHLTVHGDCPERLLLGCLRELLYLEEDQDLVPVQFTVTRLDADKLEADCEAGVASVAEARPHLLGEIKAVTYHDLSITATPEGLQVQIVFDV